MTMESRLADAFEKLDGLGVRPLVIQVIVPATDRQVLINNVRGNTPRDRRLYEDACNVFTGLNDSSSTEIQRSLVIIPWARKRYVRRIPTAGRAERGQQDEQGSEVFRSEPVAISESIRSLGTMRLPDGRAPRNTYELETHLIACLGQCQATDAWLQAFQRRATGDGKFASLFAVFSSRPSKAAQTLLEELLESALLEHYADLWKRAARRSAVAAIMSRNMSHNIGSHVVPRARLENVLKRMGPFKSSEVKDKVAVTLKGRLDDMIQKKGDFLAEITTEPLATTKPALFYREVMQPFIENTLVMDNIARNEGFGYETAGDGETAGPSNSLKFTVTISGKEVTPRYGNADGIPYTACDSNGKLLEPSFPSDAPDLEIALPGPLGEMAIYGLLENFIRNIAKHHPRPPNERGANLEIRIRVSDSDASAEFYDVELSSNRWDTSSCLVTTDELQALHRKLEGNGVFRPRDEQDEAYLTLDLIDGSGDLRRKNWGIAELRLCANLLRGCADPSPSALRESLRAELREKDNGVELIYRFRVMKSKQACLVGFPVSGEDQQALKEAGIWCFSDCAAIKAHLAGIEVPESFKFAVINSRACDAALTELWQLLPQLPFRILMVSEEGSTQFPAEISPLVAGKRVSTVAHSMWIAAPPMARQPREWLAWLWRTWVITRYSAAGCVEVYLEQTQDTIQTKEWHRVGIAVRSTSDLQLRAWCKDNVSNEVVPIGSGSCSESAPRLFLDRHAGLASVAKEKTGYALQPGGRDSYVILDKTNSDFVAVYSPPFPDLGKESDWSFPWELAEAGMLRVLIVDERVAERAIRKADKISCDSLSHFGDREPRQVTGFDVAWAAKVHICTHISLRDELPRPIHHSIPSIACTGCTPYLCLHVPPLPDDVSATNLAYTYALDTGLRSNEHLAIDLLIIHQGILDTLFPENVTEQSKVLAAFNSQIPYVVVESGRGVPHNLDDRAKFMPFSLLQTYLMGDRVAKYSLSRVSMSLVRRQRAGSC